MPISIRTPLALRVAAIVVVVLGLILLAWIGGELSYNNCLSEIELAQPPEAREAAIERCSHWP